MKWLPVILLLLVAGCFQAGEERKDYGKYYELRFDRQQVILPTDFSGKLAYYANYPKGLYDSDYSLVIDGEIIDTKVVPGTLISVSGKPAYIAIKNKNRVVVFDGKVLQSVDDFGKLLNVKGKLGIYERGSIYVDGKEYAAVKLASSDSKLVINGGGIVNPDNHFSTIKEGEIYLVANMYGEPIFFEHVNATIIEDNGKNTVYLEGKKINLDYEKIGDVAVVNGYIAAEVSKNGKTYVYYNGREFGPYNDINSINDLGGRVGFFDYNDHESSLIIEGMEFGRFKSTSDLVSVNGKAAFSALDSYNRRVIILEK